jgi:hypothetical protein
MDGSTMTKTPKGPNGGPRPGAGAPKKQDKKIYIKIGIRPKPLEQIIKQYGSPQKWADTILKQNTTTQPPT